MATMTQEEIRFSNQLSTHWTGYCRECDFKSLGSVLHYLHVYSNNISLADSVKVGEREVFYHNEQIASFILDYELRMPVFTFIDKYSHLADAQDIYVRNIKTVYDGEFFLSKGWNNITVIVVESPVTERYCKKSDAGTVRGNQIRVGGAWFNLDARWKIKIA